MNLRCQACKEILPEWNFQGKNTMCINCVIIKGREEDKTEQKTMTDFTRDKERVRN